MTGGLFRDLYVAMGEPLEGGAWAVRVQHKPFVRWLWIGGVVMTLGGLLAAFDKRYRQKAMRQAGVTVQATESENKDTGAVTGASA